MTSEKAQMKSSARARTRESLNIAEGRVLIVQSQIARQRSVLSTLNRDSTEFMLAEDMLANFYAALVSSMLERNNLRRELEAQLGDRLASHLAA